MAVVLKRDGRRESVSLDKIVKRIRTLVDSPEPRLDQCDVLGIAKTVVTGVHDGVRTSDLDNLAADAAAALASHHHHYAMLAGRIAVSNNQKMTKADFRSIFPFLADDVRAFASAHIEEINATLKFERDFRYDYFGFRTLTRSYLLRNVEGDVVERPQHLLMRVAIGVHVGDLTSALESYDLMAEGYFTHATPTMYHCGTKKPHLASCFLLPVCSDSINGIFDTVSRCAEISKSAGGIGFSVSNVRARGSAISGGSGRSSGLLPMLKCFESTARYVDQGSKRKGAFAAYLEPWHADVRVFIDMKKNHGAEELRARDLFYALWIPDLFMRRVRENSKWSLMCPSQCPDLIDLHGGAFDARYEEYEAAGAVKEVIRAQDLWFAILDAQIETGTPYMLFKDACNRKSNHQHLGTIRSSNLCTEIVQFSSPDEIAVCNLASLALPRFLPEGGNFDFDELARVTRVVTRNLNRVIDRNAYARQEARESNLRHRPLGIGVQGLADVFARPFIPFESPEAAALNCEIFETIYFSALTASCELAQSEGRYESYDGSPLSRGLLQMDFWENVKFSGRWDWAKLRSNLHEHGARNSLLVAPMPTASTAQIMGNTEAFEPPTSNIFVRRVLAGEFVVCNKHLVTALEARGLWSEDMRLRIVAANGSVQDIEEIPEDVRAVFKTAWELSMRTVIQMAADRAPFVDQSQSMNLFVADPTHKKLSAMHFFSWQLGLKTGQYYLRTKPATEAVKVCVPIAFTKAKAKAASEDDEGACEACSA